MIFTSRKRWIQTFTGRKFYPGDPRPEDIDLLDIAHALSMVCRYTGHISRFYSVAQHSLLVASRVPPRYQVHALLHDASEAYIADVSRPVKYQWWMWPYRRVERRLQRMIYERFGLDPEEPACVKLADTEVLWTESRQLFPTLHPDWVTTFDSSGIRKVDEHLPPTGPIEAEFRWLEAFRSVADTQRRAA